MWLKSWKRLCFFFFVGTHNTNKTRLGTLFQRTSCFICDTGQTGWRNVRPFFIIPIYKSTLQYSCRLGSIHEFTNSTQINFTCRDFSNFLEYLTHEFELSCDFGIRVINYYPKSALQFDKMFSAFCILVCFHSMTFAFSISKILLNGVKKMFTLLLWCLGWYDDIILRSILVCFG